MIAARCYDMSKHSKGLWIMHTDIKDIYDNMRNSERGDLEDSWQGVLFSIVAVFVIVGLITWMAVKDINAEGPHDDGWDAPAHVRADTRLESTVLEVAAVIDGMLSERGLHDKATEFTTVLDIHTDVIIVTVPIMTTMTTHTNIVRVTIGSMNQGISEKQADLEWQPGDSITTLMGDKPGEYRIFAYSANSGTYTATEPYVYDSAIEPTILTERFP